MTTTNFYKDTFSTVGATLYFFNLSASYFFLIEYAKRNFLIHNQSEYSRLTDLYHSIFDNMLIKSCLDVSCIHEAIKKLSAYDSNKPFRFNCDKLHNKPCSFSKKYGFHLPQKNKYENCVTFTKKKKTNFFELESKVKCFTDKYQISYVDALYEIDIIQILQKICYYKSLNFSSLVRLFPISVTYKLEKNSILHNMPESIDSSYKIRTNLVDISNIFKERLIGLIIWDVLNKNSLNQQYNYSKQYNGVINEILPEALLEEDKEKPFLNFKFYREDLDIDFEILAKKLFNNIEYKYDLDKTLKNTENNINKFGALDLLSNLMLK